MESTNLQNLAAEETYQDGQIIFKEGSAGDWIYIIVSGSVEISKEVRGEKRIIEILHAGEVFGELGFIGGIKRTATARAIGITTLGIIDREFLDNEFNKLSSQFRVILIAITHRFRKMLERACDFTSRDEPRVTKTLTLTFKNKDSFIRAYSADISAGGLFIKTEKPLPEGSRFNLKLNVPGRTEPIQLMAEVMWSRQADAGKAERPAGMGVKFCEIADKNHRFIKKYVADALNRT